MLPTVGAIVSVIPERGAGLRAPLRGAEERTGAGVQEWSDGSRYEGEFVNGFKHGRGKYTWKNGESYVGSFYKDFRHGDGVYCWPSGHKFIGKFYLNRKEGYGQHVFPNGSHFQGLYHADQRFGPGVLTYPDGRQDVGLWHNERLLQLCTTVGEGFTLKDLPEYATYMDTSTTAEQSVLWSQTSFKHPKFSDDTYVLPTGIEIFSTDGDHLPLPPKRREELDHCFYGDEWEPDMNPYQGYERDPLSTLPLEARMQAHILKHRLQGKNQSWDVEAVLSLTRRGFGPKGHLEVSSEQLILQASRGEHRAVAQILRTGLVHPDVADALRYTALIAATVNCCDDVIEVLLDMGADIDKLNGENMSALAVCHVLYYPFNSLYTTELQDSDKEREVELVKSAEPYESSSVKNTQNNEDRPNTMETVQTPSHVFSEGAGEEETEDILQQSEVANERALVAEEGLEPIDPQTPADNEMDPEDKTDETQEEQTQEIETEIKETEDVYTGEAEAGAEENIECDLNENDKEESQEVASIERSVEVKDGKIVVGNVQWKEYPAKGKIHGSNETPTFDSAGSVNSFQIHVTEKALHRSAEALSRTGFTPSLDTEETVRKMAAMKIEHRERLNTLKLLLDRGADPNACRVPMPVLFMAVMASDVEAVKRLLLCGARTDIQLPPQRKGLYPLHVAAALPGSAGPKITELLLHAITDPDARASDQNEMYQTDQVSVICLFSKETSDAIRSTVETRDREGGTTALHVACRRHTDYQNTSKIVALLLSHGARTDLLWSGHSPLSLAIASGNEMAVEELLKCGADPNVPLGNRVGSALCALANNNYHLCGNRQKLLDLLLKAGADILMPVLVDNVEGTAVDYAYYSYHQDTRIATTPYHALSIQEREICKERQQLLRMMGNVLRQTALQRERKRQHRTSMDGHETNDSMCAHSSPKALEPPLFKFCLYCSRAASVKLTSCSRCHMVFYCSKACKIKSWNEGHKDECTQIISRSAQLQSKPCSQRRARGADASQKNELKTQRGAKDAMKSKTVRRALNLMYKPKITKFMKFDLKSRALNVTEATVEEQPKENYSFI
ncbi:ankyrin repeat and MYND domain-containing protein 1 [Periophthalmus magnuspinnatus]|uniref:ankyrin repeat and MYND domain-containing protein 1 n=1 Tax=Periophthalmus magnuspinnatus TaxID=409849 RepID=UPI002436A61A|nr:ankyrin repeat and MYND domain-containing protein 1 [Periophthalmus magnuspinnatus]